MVSGASPNMSLVRAPALRVAQSCGFPWCIYGLFPHVPAQMWVIFTVSTNDSLVICWHSMSIWLSWGKGPELAQDKVCPPRRTKGFVIPLLAVTLSFQKSLPVWWMDVVFQTGRDVLPCTFHSFLPSCSWLNLRFIFQLTNEFPIDQLPLFVLFSARPFK